MPPAPLSPNESSRLAKLRSLGVLDTETESRFDRITALASQITGAPIAAVSLVDDHRQFFKSICGLDVRETPRDHAFCAYTILNNEALVIEDATTHPLVKDNPLVTGAPGIRFYAGYPINIDGLNIGSLCVIDLEPRAIDEAQVRALRDLAAITSSELTSRTLQMEAQASTRAKSMFLANMSHEIRSPLSAILGYAEVLSESGPDKRVFEESIRSISYNASHLLHLIGEILDFSKIEAEQLEIEMIPMRLHDVIAQASEMLDIAADRAGIRVKTEFDNTARIQVLGDPTRLRQIVINLLSNAIKYSDGQDVRIELQGSESADPTIAYELRVTDQGIGMTTEQRSRVFEEFRQADASSTRRFGGTGLGLAIVERLTKAMGGSIEVESEPGAGSIFIVKLRLPRAEHNVDTAPTQSEVPAVKHTSQRLKDRRILIAEDGIDNQRLLRHFLEAEGAVVFIVTDGEQAVAAASESGTPFDCILMDVQMPVLDGCEATRRIRANGCTTPILALTANTMSETINECLLAGCDRYANKPLSRAKLTEIVEHLIDNESRRAA